jgi:hypothetical protein
MQEVELNGVSTLSLQDKSQLRRNQKSALVQHVVRMMRGEIEDRSVIRV